MIESISLQRGPCEGTCPVYAVTFEHDGTARWRGEHFVEPVGRFVGTVDATDFAKLADFVTGHAFFSWKDTLPDGTCTPDHSIEVRSSDGDKCVTQWDGSETREFRRLAAAIDRAAARIGWTPRLKGDATASAA